MVIYCKRPNQIPLIPWEDIHNLSQILHIPGTDSRVDLSLNFRRFPAITVIATAQTWGGLEPGDDSPIAKDCGSKSRRQIEC